MSLSPPSNPRVLLRLAGFLKPYRLQLLLAGIALVVAASGLLLLGQGRLIASGTHAELLESSPLYRQLAKLQFRDG